MESFFSALPRLSDLVFCRPWMIKPSFHRDTLVPQLLAARGNQDRLAGLRMEREEESPDQRRARQHAAYQARLVAAGTQWLITPENRRALVPYNMDAKSGIAQINVNGIIGKGLDSWDMACGGICVDQMVSAMQHLAELQPRALALHFSTPGGSVTGVPEAAQYIQDWSAEVAPVHAYTDTLCCSAGVYLGYAADTFSAAGSADIGSIGVYSAVVDSSKFYQEKGIDITLLASGWAKGQGYPGTAVDPAYIESVRADVQRHASRFFSWVAQRRQSMIEAEAAQLTAASGTEVSPASWAAQIMQGQSWTAQDAPRALLDGHFPNRAAHIAALMRV